MKKLRLNKALLFKLNMDCHSKHKSFHICVCVCWPRYLKFLSGLLNNPPEPNNDCGWSWKRKSFSARSVLLKIFLTCCWRCQTLAPPGWERTWWLGLQNITSSECHSTAISSSHLVKISKLGQRRTYWRRLPKRPPRPPLPPAMRARKSGTWGERGHHTNNYEKEDKFKVSSLLTY